MKETLSIEAKNKLICLDSHIVYLQKPYWCNATTRQLFLSLMKPRNYFDYDTPGKYPLLLFICGGAFQKEDINAFMPELAFYAKKGFVVACADYSTLPYTEHPEPLTEIKAAIRFLRAHADQFDIDPAHVIVSGESAGGYLAGLCAVTNGFKEYEIGDNLDQSSEVQGAVLMYPLTKMNKTNSAAAEAHGKIVVRLDNYPDLLDFVNKETVPICMVHGTKDGQVSFQHSARLEKKMTSVNAYSELYLVEGADHGDQLLYQDCIKEKILKFMKEYC